jgi:hypothetical protein
MLQHFPQRPSPEIDVEVVKVLARSLGIGGFYAEAPISDQKTRGYPCHQCPLGRKRSNTVRRKKSSDVL